MNKRTRDERVYDLIKNIKNNRELLGEDLQNKILKDIELKIANDLAIRLINNPDETDIKAILKAFKSVQELGDLTK